MKRVFQYLGTLGIIIVFIGLLIWFLVPPILNHNTGLEDKTLWDRLELVVIPLALALIAFWLNNSEKQNARHLALDIQQDKALRSYVDRMADLLMNDYDRLFQDGVTRNVASARTLTLLRELDKDRKAEVIKFLYEAKLIQKDNTAIQLTGADLRYIDLSHTDLLRCNLSGADLRHANLIGTVLTFSNLRRADLRYANMFGGVFADVDLLYSDLRHAILYFTNLNKAELGYCKVTGIQILFIKEIRKRFIKKPTFRT